MWVLGVEPGSSARAVINLAGQDYSLTRITAISRNYAGPVSKTCSSLQGLSLCTVSHRRKVERGSRDPHLNNLLLLPTGVCNFSNWRQVLGEGPEEMGGEEKNGCEVQSFLPHADLPGLLHSRLLTYMATTLQLSTGWKLSLINSLISLGELRDICLSQGRNFSRRFYYIPSAPDFLPFKPEKIAHCVYIRFLLVLETGPHYVSCADLELSIL